MNLTSYKSVGIANSTTASAFKNTNSNNTNPNISSKITAVKIVNPLLLCVDQLDVNAGVNYRSR